MKKQLGFIAVMGLVLTAVNCQKSNTPPSEPSGLADPQTAQLLYQIGTGVSGYEGIFSATPQGMKGMIEGTAKRKQGDVCGSAVIITPTDTTDADGDGIPVDVRISVNCDTTVTDSAGNSYRVMMMGDMVLRDTNDQDPWVGYASLGGPVDSQFFYIYYGDGMNEYESGFAGSVESSHQQNTFGASEQITLLQRFNLGGVETTVVYADYAHLRFTPQDPTWTPADTGVMSGELSVADTVYFHNSAGDEFGFILTTPTPLQLDADCDDPNDDDTMGGDPVSGELQITDGQHTLLIRWKGCGQREVFLDDQPFNPAL